MTTYFNDCFRFTSALKRVLSRGGVGVVVIGNSIIQGMDIRTEQILGEIGAMQGLIPDGVHWIRDKRVGRASPSHQYGREKRAKPYFPNLP